MSTPLDLYALTQMRELEAAIILIGASTAELRAVATLCHLRPKPKDDKHTMVAMILTVTHPKASPPPPDSQYQQERFV